MLGQESSSSSWVQTHLDGLLLEARESETKRRGRNRIVLGSNYIYHRSRRVEDMAVDVVPGSSSWASCAVREILPRRDSIVPCVWRDPICQAVASANKRRPGTFQKAGAYAEKLGNSFLNRAITLATVACCFITAEKGRSSEG